MMMMMMLIVIMMIIMRQYMHLFRGIEMKENKLDKLTIILYKRHKDMLHPN